MLWTADVFADGAQRHRCGLLWRKLKPCQVKLRPHDRLSTESAIQWLRIDGSFRSPIRWRRVCNDLKQRCSIALMISHVQRIRNVRMCSSSCFCTGHPYEWFCSPALQGGAAWRAKRPLLVCQGHGLTSVLRHWTIASFGTSWPKYDVHENNKCTGYKLKTLRHAANGWWHTRVLTLLMTSFAFDGSVSWLKLFCVALR